MHKIAYHHRRNRRVTLKNISGYRHQKEKEEMEAFCSPASETKQTVAAASTYGAPVEPEGKAASTDTQNQLLRHDPPRRQNPLSQAFQPSTGATTAYASCGVLGTLMATDWPFSALQTAPLWAARACMPQNGRKGGGSWLTHKAVPLWKQGRRRGGVEGHRGLFLEAGPARTSPDAPPHALMGLTSRQVAAPRRSMRTEGGAPIIVPSSPSEVQTPRDRRAAGQSFV